MLLFRESLTINLNAARKLLTRASNEIIFNILRVIFIDE